MTSHAFVCGAVRTPFGRYGGALSSVRADDLGAVPLAALMTRHPKLDWQAVVDVIDRCANQVGEASTGPTGHAAQSLLRTSITNSRHCKYADT